MSRPPSQLFYALCLLSFIVLTSLGATCCIVWLDTRAKRILSLQCRHILPTSTRGTPCAFLGECGPATQRLTSRDFLQRNTLFQISVARSLMNACKYNDTRNGVGNGVPFREQVLTDQKLDPGLTRACQRRPLVVEGSSGAQPRGCLDGVQRATHTN